MSRHGNLIALPVDAPNGIGWVSIAGPAPIAELRHVHATVPCLAVEHPGLRAFEGFANLPLREAGFLPQFPEEGGDVGVTPFVLGFGQHERLRIGARYYYRKTA